jgi:hypothetical protein
VSDTNLHGVLNMPIDCWYSSDIDEQQRRAIYVQASIRIVEQEKELAELREAKELLGFIAKQVDEEHEIHIHKHELIKGQSSSRVKVVEYCAGDSIHEFSEINKDQIVACNSVIGVLRKAKEMEGD